MILIKKIDTFKELDKLLPIIFEIHSKSDFYNLYSISGFIGYLTLGLQSPNMGIWIVQIDNAIIGYAIAIIEVRFFERECIIQDAYIKENKEEIVSVCYKEIEEWAKQNGCKYLSCYTERDMAIDKKYGFKSKLVYMTKEV